MVDINKYLETQLALAKQKNGTKQQRKAVSTKSIVAAEQISKKQYNEFNNKSNSKLVQVENKILLPANRESDDDSYLLSDDDDDRVPYLLCRSRHKQAVTKILDDGDNKFYKTRLENWRKTLKLAISGKHEGDTYTADIKYVLDGNKDLQVSHELQNGFLVPIYIWRQLYKYQRTAVKWLWELHQTQSGGMLGDEMGLGKTVQIIAFLAGLSKTNAGSWGGLGPSIIIAPATVIYQWVTHFHYWCPFLRVAVLHHSGSYVGNHNKLIRELHTSHGILLITYAGIVKYFKDLISHKWHYIILDEGHKIRNPDIQVSKLVKKFETPHRILITGSPMQNSLQELWSLFDFMHPGLLGTQSVFMEHFAMPITQGGYANATEFQEATALEIAKALKNMITPYMLRRTKSEVQEFIKLPEKSEQVLFCALSQEQRDLYMGYLMSGTVRSILDKEKRFGEPYRARVLIALSTLRKICNHPDIYLYEAQENQEYIDYNKFGYWKRSGKMNVVQSLLKIWQKQGHRALLFTQSRAMLCILEQFLQTYKYKYLKMDGSVGVGQRQNLIKTFNENSEYLVFLATTRVGGLGVNLTGANRVIIYDPDWNPATDSQAKERAWRIGQQRNVTVYRLLSAGTIEEKIYQRQIFKHFLSNKILIDPHQKNVLTTSTLQGLFTLEEPNHNGDTETASLFKHTKVDLNDKNKVKEKNDNIHLSGSVSFSKTKLEAMRRKAREISEKISNSISTSQKLEDDPREKYKKKRELLLNSTKLEEKTEINLLDDKATNVPFESVLSELDIVNIHTKKDYEENLIKDVLKKQSESNEYISSDNIIKAQSNLEIVDDKDVERKLPKTNYDEHNIPNSTKRLNKTKYKRKYSVTESDPEIEHIVTVKKIKDKKPKRQKDIYNDDDYVLSKLFAKSTVKTALQHDVVVGLAEKEKRHRIMHEATKRAKSAVRAVKFSCS